MPRKKDSRQLAKWMPVVNQVVRETVLKPRIARLIGDEDDIRQVAVLAVLKEVVSPRFEKALRKDAYLSKAIRSAMALAAGESALIRHDRRRAAEVMAAQDKGISVSRSLHDVRRAMTLQLSDDMDSFGLSPNQDEPSARSLRAVRDVCDAVDALPAPLRRLMGHWFGVSGYDKLSPKEIARKTGVKVETVWRRAYEGRRLLRSILREYGYGGCASDERKQENCGD